MSTSTLYIHTHPSLSLSLSLSLTHTHARTHTHTHIGSVLYLMSPDDPAQCVPKLVHHQKVSNSVLSGYYRVNGNQVTTTQLYNAVKTRVARYCTNVGLKFEIDSANLFSITSRTACLLRASLLWHTNDREETPTCLTMVCACQLVGCCHLLGDVDLLYMLQHEAQTAHYYEEPSLAI